RRITGRAGEAALDLELGITARRPAVLPIGLHPILRLPERPGALIWSVGFDRGLTYPGTVPPGAMVTRPAQEFADLSRVPAADGGTTDLSRIPFEHPVEDVVQLCGVTPPLVADLLDEGVRLELDWDAVLLPSLLVWISDRA